MDVHHDRNIVATGQYASKKDPTIKVRDIVVSVVVVVVVVVVIELTRDQLNIQHIEIIFLPLQLL